MYTRWEPAVGLLRAPRFNDQSEESLEVRKNSWAQYDATLLLLNDSLNTCLR